MANKKIPESWTTEKIAGKELLRPFRKRDCDLLPPTSQMNLFKYYKEISLRYDFTPEKIWNCDKTGFTTVHVPPKIFGQKSQADRTDE